MDGVPVLIDLLRSDEAKDCRGNIAPTLEEITGHKVGGYNDYEAWNVWWEKEGKQSIKMKLERDLQEQKATAP